MSRKIRGSRYIRIPLLLLLISFVAWTSYSLWTPGRSIQNGRFDLSNNGVWLQHSWFASDSWFVRQKQRKKPSDFRSVKAIKKLYKLLQKHHIKYVFPHVAPTTQGSRLPRVHDRQVQRFLRVFKGVRVVPWIGGVWNKQAFPQDPKWRRRFTKSIGKLLKKHPQLAGVHINIEPCLSGNPHFFRLLEETRRVLRPGQLLSVAAYPPPTFFQQSLEVHWEKEYYQEISKRADQMVVMMYDTSLRFQKLYQHLLSSWTAEVLNWSTKSQVMLGIPAYEDKGLRYHHPKVENIHNSILGINAALSKYDRLPGNYQGIAIYSEWTMNPSKWKLLRQLYLKKSNGK